jgi:hypothetical protein
MKYHPFTYYRRLGLWKDALLVVVVINCRQLWDLFFLRFAVSPFAWLMPGLPCDPFNWWTRARFSLSEWSLRLDFHMPRLCSARGGSLPWPRLMPESERRARRFSCRRGRFLPVRFAIEGYGLVSDDMSMDLSVRTVCLHLFVCALSLRYPCHFTAKVAEWYHPASKPANLEPAFHGSE